MLYLDEVPSSGGLRALSIAVSFSGLAAITVVIPWRRKKDEGAEPDATRNDEEGPAKSAARLLPEYYFVIAVGLLISSVTWEFYVIWLLPAFIGAFFCADRVLPSGPLRHVFLAAFALALVLLNYPGDMYLFVPNGVFFHPSLVPGVFVEDHVRLYHTHLDAVLFLRLPGLLLIAGTLALLVQINGRGWLRRGR